jgi:hypothetical protein
MHDASGVGHDKVERRLQAVLALFRQEPMARVRARFGIGRSDLYKFQRRAASALREALQDHPRGPRSPHNRLPPSQEAVIQGLCERHPTWSSYQVHHRVGPDAPCVRTIQRVRKRCGLPRVPKRPRPQRPAKRFSPEEKHRAQHLIEAKPSLGPERVAWELQTQHGLHMSPSTVKRHKRALHDALHPSPAPLA